MRVERPVAMDKVVLDGSPVGKRILRLVGNLRKPLCSLSPRGEGGSSEPRSGEPGEGAGT